MQGGWLVAGVGSCGRWVSRSWEKAFNVAAVALLALAMFAGEVRADPVGVPDFGIDVETILGVVQTQMTLVLLPLILFSIGVMIVLMLWRAAKRFSGAKG